MNTQAAKLLGVMINLMIWNIFGACLFGSLLAWVLLSAFEKRIRRVPIRPVLMSGAISAGVSFIVYCTRDLFLYGGFPWDPAVRLVYGHGFWQQWSSSLPVAGNIVAIAVWAILLVLVPVILVYKNDFRLWVSYSVTVALLFGTAWLVGPLLSAPTDCVDCAGSRTPIHFLVVTDNASEVSANVLAGKDTYPVTTPTGGVTIGLSLIGKPNSIVKFQVTSKMTGSQTLKQPISTASQPLIEDTSPAPVQPCNSEFLGSKIGTTGDIANRGSMQLDSNGSGMVILEYAEDPSRPYKWWTNRADYQLVALPVVSVMFDSTGGCYQNPQDEMSRWSLPTSASLRMASIWNQGFDFQTMNIQPAPSNGDSSAPVWEVNSNTAKSAFLQPSFTVTTAATRGAYAFRLFFGAVLGGLAVTALYQLLLELTAKFGGGGSPRGGRTGRHVSNENRE